MTFLNKNRPVVLSLAGFDPCGGAGILADIKTFETSHVYGLGINTGITIQNDIEFKNVKWESDKSIQEGVMLLAKRFEVKAAKLGLHQNLQQVFRHVELLKKVWPNIKIVWDPVLSSSSGFDFKISISRKKLLQVLSRINLITPNQNEFKQLGLKAEEYPCNLLLKGGHTTGKYAEDILFAQGKKKKVFKSLRGKKIEKHGSGCVLSAAITAELAKNKSLDESISSAKKYITRFLYSTTTLIGYHQS